MRSFLLATSFLIAASSASFAQNAPVFRSVAEDPSLQLPANAPRVDTSAAPAPSKAEKAAPVKKPLAAAPTKTNDTPTTSPAVEVGKGIGPIQVKKETPSATHTDEKLHVLPTEYETKTSEGHTRIISRSGEDIESEGNGAIPALPLEMTTENGISYISGGISDEETDQLKAEENNFNLRLQITGMHGEYVSIPSFTLKTAKGQTVATINDAGPYVYFQVPAGDYVADIAANGKGNKQVKLKVPAKGALKSQIRL